MPLYWYTDKLIANGKYRLKKKIEVKPDGFVALHMFNRLSYAPSEDEMIYEIEDILQGIENDNVILSEEEKKVFIEKLMPYLEEAPKKTECGMFRPK